MRTIDVSARIDGHRPRMLCVTIGTTETMVPIYEDDVETAVRESAIRWINSPEIGRYLKTVIRLAVEDWQSQNQLGTSLRKIEEAIARLEKVAGTNRRVL